LEQAVAVANRILLHSQDHPAYYASTSYYSAFSAFGSRKENAELKKMMRARTLSAEDLNQLHDVSVYDVVEVKAEVKKGKKSVSGTKLEIICSVFLRLLPSTVPPPSSVVPARSKKPMSSRFVDDQAVEEGEEGEEEEEEEQEAGLNTFFGHMVRDDALADGCIDQVNTWLKEVNCKNIFIGLDIPYFTTRELWDNPKFVGHEKLEFPAKVVDMLVKYTANRSGMALIFANSNYQMEELKKCLHSTMKTSNVNSVIKIYISRKNYKSKLVLQPDRKVLLNNVEECLQVAFGDPVVDYQHSQMLRSRDNLIVCNWERMHKINDATCNPAQKPVHFWSEFLKCVQCDVVLDLFAGTGSLSYAAIKHDKPFIAVERSAAQIDGYNSRLRVLVTSSGGAVVNFSPPRSGSSNYIRNNNLQRRPNPPKGLLIDERSNVPEVSGLVLLENEETTLSPVKPKPQPITYAKSVDFSGQC
jgi:hypothetical protein